MRKKKICLLKGNRERTKRKGYRIDITEVEEDANIEYPSHEASEEMSYIFENLP